MLLEPGRGVEAGSDVERAAHILEVAQALGKVKELMGRSVHDRALKEVIWNKWEHPRLPRPLIDGKYPASYPWSLAARETYRRSPLKRGRLGELVIEHVLPKSELLALIETELPSLTASGMAELLQDWCCAVVLTKDEDRKITKAGFGGRRPNTEEIWSRYSAAGIDLSTFEPLER